MQVFHVQDLIEALFNSSQIGVLILECVRVCVLFCIVIWLMTCVHIKWKLYDLNMTVVFRSIDVFEFDFEIR